MGRNAYDADVAKHEAKYSKSTPPTCDYVAELENERDELGSIADGLYSIIFNHINLNLEFPDQVDHTDIKQLLEAHNLEQQANGVDSLRFPSKSRRMWLGSEVQEWLSDKADSIRSQAKEQPNV